MVERPNVTLGFTSCCTYCGLETMSFESFTAHAQHIQSKLLLCFGQAQVEVHSLSLQLHFERF